MTDRRAFCSLLAGLSALPNLSRAQAAKPTVWKLATGYRADSFHGQNLQQLAAELAKGSGGLRMELHPNNSLFKLADIPAAVREGKVEMGETIMSSMAKDIPLAGADAVPFLVRSYADSKRLWQYQRPLIEKKFAAVGLTPLMAVPWPPQGLYSTKPISRAGDLKGARMRTYNATTVRIAELLGAIPVDVPMVQVGKALAEGHIDCMITSAVTGVENQVWDHVKHYYEINAWFPKNITFAQTKALDALSDAARRELLKAAATAETRGWAASEQVAAESVDELRRKGIKTERLSPEFLADLKRLGERFSREWINQVGPEANYVFIPYYANQ